MTRTQDGSGYGGIDAQRRRARRGGQARRHRPLTRSSSTDDTRLPHTGSSTAAPGIPAAALSTPDAELLERLTARGKPVREAGHAVEQQPKAPPTTSSARSPAGGGPTRFWGWGPPANFWDPGPAESTTQPVWAIMTAAAKLAAGPGVKRTIRVVMFGSEEQQGSSLAYLTVHRDEVGKLVVAGESDGGRGASGASACPPAAATTPR